MNSAIIFISNPKESELAKVKLFEKYLIDYTVSQIKRLDIDRVFLVGKTDFVVDNVIPRNSVYEVIEELRNEEGKCILTSPFYPLIDKNDYLRLLSVKNNSAFVDEHGNIVPIFTIYNKHLAYFDRISYSGVVADKYKSRRFMGTKDIAYFQTIIKKLINNRWLNRGVIITDPNSTIIGVDVMIDKGTIVYPNTTIQGKSVIGKNNIIGSNSILNSVVIGDNNDIKGANISNSTIHNNVIVGNNCSIEENSEISDKARIGSLVKLTNTKVGKSSVIDQLTYLGDVNIGENVSVGSGVVSVNYDGRSRHTSIIKSHSVIGSNVSLVSPVTIGEYVVVAAGSTINEDVKDGDMAIARLYQQNKKGYGYKYTKED